MQLDARTDNYLNRTVPSTGLTVAFTPDGAATAAPFNGGPNGSIVPRVQVDWQNQSGDTYAITGLSLSQMTITFSNGGAPVTRSGVTIVAQGY